MKKTFIVYSLFLLITSCNIDSTSIIDETEETELNQEETVLIKDSKETLPINEIKAVETINCPSFELTAYLNDPDNSGTNIRNSPNGETLLKLKEGDEIYAFILTVTEVQNGWFKVNEIVDDMGNQIEIPNGEGWIHGSVIGISTRNYLGQDLSLLDKPKDGETIGIIKDETFGLSLLDVCGNWVKVSYKGTEGWIESNWLCGNPLTTCA